MRRCRLLMSFQEGLEGDLGGIECDGAAYFKKVHSRNGSFKEISSFF